jgi:hypothetical protein
MFLYHILFACLFSSIRGAPLPSSSVDLLRGLNLTIDELGATVFSLLYGSPLVQFYQLAATTLQHEGTNVLGSHNTTATASTRNVVRPNVDTVYAAGTFDLSATDLVLTMPLMAEDRFYLFAFYDPSVFSIYSLTTIMAGASMRN